MLFDPAANLTGRGMTRRPAGLGLRIIAGDAAVGQVCCDPGTFADVTTLVGEGVEVAPLTRHGRALLGMVWPGSFAQARLLWGGRIAGRAGTLGVDALVPAVIEDVIGVPAGLLREVAARGRAVQRGLGDPFVRAAVPLALLHLAIVQEVRARAGAGRPETVLDELLFWRGLGHERVSLEEVAALVTALTAAAWDAMHGLLPRLLDASATAPRARLTERVLRRGPQAIGWLRVTTQAALLGGVEIPAGSRCLLVVGAAAPGAQAARPELQTLRRLSPNATAGTGAVLARLVGDALLTTLPEPAVTAPAPAPRALVTTLPEPAVATPVPAPRRHSA